MFLNIISANIADHIIYADIYHEAFAYFVDEVEIIMEMLDDEAAPIEEVCVESEEEEKMEEVEYSSEGINKDMYTGHKYSYDLHQLCPMQKMCKEWTSNQVDWKKFLTA